MQIPPPKNVSALDADVVDAMGKFALAWSGGQAGSLGPAARIWASRAPATHKGFSRAAAMLWRAAERLGNARTDAACLLVAADALAADETLRGDARKSFDSVRRAMDADMRDLEAAWRAMADDMRHLDRAVRLSPHAEAAVRRNAAERSAARALAARRCPPPRVPPPRVVVLEGLPAGDRLWQCCVADTSDDDVAEILRLLRAARLLDVALVGLARLIAAAPTSAATRVRSVRAMRFVCGGGHLGTAQLISDRFGMLAAERRGALRHAVDGGHTGTADWLRNWLDCMTPLAGRAPAADAGRAPTTAAGRAPTADAGVAGPRPDAGSPMSGGEWGGLAGMSTDWTPDVD
jgi:hypothetical protein